MFNCTKKHSIIAALAVVTPLATIGCNGPTKSGNLAREAARARLDEVNGRVSYDQAMQSFEVGQLDRALREISGAIARFPKEAEFHVLQGRIYLEMGGLEKAMDAFGEAIELNEESHEAHYFAGIVCQRWSRSQQAFDHYQRAFEIAPDRAQYMTASAESLVALERYSEASALITEHLDYFEHSSALHQLLGQIAIIQGDARRGAELLMEARMLKPDDDMLLEEVALAQFDAGMYRDCYESLRERQATLIEKRTDLMHLEARCLTMIGRETDARNLYVKLTRLNPHDPDIWAELGMLAWSMGDYMRVAQCGSRLVAIAPERFEGFLFKGAHARQHNEHGDAIKYFYQASMCSPDDATPLMLLGSSMERLGRTEDARIAYRNAVRLDPSNEEAKQLLAQLRSGDSRVTGEVLTSVDVDAARGGNDD